MPSQAAPDEAAVVVGSGVVRLEPDRLVVVHDGVFVPSQIAPGGAAVVVGSGIVRLEPDRLVVVRDGLLVLFQVVSVAAAVVVGSGMIRLEPDRLVVVGDGLFVPSQIALGAAADIVGGGLVRPEPDRIVAVGDGLFVPSQTAPDEAAANVGSGKIRLEPDRLGVGMHGLLQVRPVVPLARGRESVATRQERGSAAFRHCIHPTACLGVCRRLHVSQCSNLRKEVFAEIFLKTRMLQLVSLLVPATERAVAFARYKPQIQRFSGFLDRADDH